VREQAAVDFKPRFQATHEVENGSAVPLANRFSRIETTQLNTAMEKLDRDALRERGQFAPFKKRSFTLSTPTPACGKPQHLGFPGFLNRLYRPRKRLQQKLRKNPFIRCDCWQE
jgi:hypothetical protein